MTLFEYMQELDEIIAAAPEIYHVNILRRTIEDTGMEVVVIYRYKLILSDGSLLELTERLVEENNTITVTKYRHHWQNQDGTLIKRWDNAPHHSELETFPHHVHDSSETNVLEHHEIWGRDVLSHIILQIVERT